MTTVPPSTGTTVVEVAEFRIVRPDIAVDDVPAGGLGPVVAVDESELPIHTWLPRLRTDAQRGFRKTEVWGFAVRERRVWGASVEVCTVRAAVAAGERSAWPDTPGALRDAGTLFASSSHLAPNAVARGILDLDGDAEERALDLAELFGAGVVSAPKRDTVPLRVRCAVFGASDRPSDAVREVVLDGQAWRLSFGTGERVNPRDRDRAGHPYLVVSLSATDVPDSASLTSAATQLRDAAEVFGVHEVLARSAKKVNDRLSGRINALIHEETEFHEVDNIQRDAAQLRREFTDALEAVWSLDPTAGPLVAALSEHFQVERRWEREVKRFERLASIADTAPAVGPPIAGPALLVRSDRVGRAPGEVIRAEPRMRVQFLLVFVRWWEQRALVRQFGGETVDDPQRVRAEVGRGWATLLRVGDRAAGAANNYRAGLARRADGREQSTGDAPRTNARALLGRDNSGEASATRPRVIELHPFRNRPYLFEELNGAMQRSTFLAASSLVFLGVVLQTRDSRPVSQIDVFLLLMAVFGFLLATLMLSRLSTRLARRTTIDFDRRFRAADRVSDYLGVFPLLLALPLLLCRYLDNTALQTASALGAVVVTGVHLRLSSRLHVDIADDALSTARFRDVVSLVIVGSMAATFAAEIAGPPSLVTTIAVVYVVILIVLTVGAGLVPPWSDDIDYGEVPPMRDGSYAVHPWDALSEESPSYYRRTFGSDYRGPPPTQPHSSARGESP